MGADKELRTVETFDGETMTLAELIKKIGVKPEDIVISFKGGTTVSYIEKNPEDDVTVSSLIKHIISKSLKVVEKKLDEKL
jgi:hypothetical protein